MPRPTRTKISIAPKIPTIKKQKTYGNKAFEAELILQIIAMHVILCFKQKSYFFYLAFLESQLLLSWEEAVSSETRFWQLGTVLWDVTCATVVFKHCQGAKGSRFLLKCDSHLPNLKVFCLQQNSTTIAMLLSN